LPRAVVLGVGVLATSLSAASGVSLAAAAATSTSTLKDEDAGDLHERLRTGGMEDGDSEWGFGGKQEAATVTEGDISVAAEQDNVSLKQENNLVGLVLLESDWIWTWI
jgi:hypothetical protein